VLSAKDEYISAMNLVTGIKDRRAKKALKKQKGRERAMSGSSSKSREGSKEGTPNQMATGGLGDEYDPMPKIQNPYDQLDKAKSMSI
jgi:hypothetical protein